MKHGQKVNAARQHEHRIAPRGTSGQPGKGQPRRRPSVRAPVHMKRCKTREKRCTRLSTSPCSPRARQAECLSRIASLAGIAPEAAAFCLPVGCLEMASAARLAFAVWSGFRLGPSHSVLFFLFLGHVLHLCLAKLLAPNVLQTIARIHCVWSTARSTAFLGLSVALLTRGPGRETGTRATSTKGWCAPHGNPA